MEISAKQLEKYEVINKHYATGGEKLFLTVEGEKYQLSIIDLRIEDTKMFRAAPVEFIHSVPAIQIDRSKTWQEEQKVDLFLFDIPTGSIERKSEWTDVYVLDPEVISYLASLDYRRKVYSSQSGEVSAGDKHFVDALTYQLDDLIASIEESKQAKSEATR